MLTDALNAFVERLKHVPGIVATVVGGSQARGTANPSSDTDLGLYYDRQSPLNTAALDAIATACDDRKCAGLITELGAWCPWINGGGWLRLGGQSVDLLFRETSKIQASLDDAILGQIEIAYQPGHPFGFLSSIYVGEIALCLPLWDPSHWVAKQKKKSMAIRNGFVANWSDVLFLRPTSVS